MNPPNPEPGRFTGPRPATRWSASMVHVGSGRDNAGMESLYALPLRKILTKASGPQVELFIAVLTWTEHKQLGLRRQTRLGRLIPIKYDRYPPDPSCRLSNHRRSRARRYHHKVPERRKENTHDR